MGLKLMKDTYMRCLGMILLSVALTHQSSAQPESETTINGFVDVYYAYSFTRPPSRDRSFTTQPLRHNEFNLNLAMIDVRHQGDRFRGRFAFQTGTYVQSNLIAEPSLLKNVLEASAGTRFGDNVWVDVGIFPSHIGMEGIVSKDNWNYSRSLVADYSPYYEAGVSVTAGLSDQITVRGLVVNGWQNIMETNGDKAIGTQIQFKPSESVLLNWSTFTGNEAPDSAASRLRIFNDVYAVVTLTPAWTAALVFDIGVQENDGNSSDLWHGGSLMTRYSFSENWAVGGRLEYFSDEAGVIVPTGTPENFQTVSASVNIDLTIVPNLVWRIEGRMFESKDAIYPSGSGLKTNDGFVAVSAALSL
jgi:hypothetical protein